jgi:probable HAF family extracellular repeat protein
VAYHQQFADGSDVRDEVRLVKDYWGNWSWFFGRDRAAVAEQIARVAPGSNAGTPPASRAGSSTEATTSKVAYRITDLSTGAGNWGSADSINERGDVLWSWGTAADDPTSERVSNLHPMLWQAGTVTDLAHQGLDATTALNAVGAVLARAGGHAEVYQTDTGAINPLTAFDGGYAVDINDAGTVVGRVGNVGVIVTQGTVQTIPVPPDFTTIEPWAINNAGQVVGRVTRGVSVDAHQRAFLFADGLVTLLPLVPGAAASSASALNEGGQVVGNPGIPQAGRAWIYDPGTGQTTDIGTLPGNPNSTAFAINNLGQVVGNAWSSASTPGLTGAAWKSRAYLYDHRSRVMTELDELIPHTIGGWTLVGALDINDAGQIVGRGMIGGEMHAFVLTPVQ